MIRPPMMYVPIRPEQLVKAFETLAAKHGEAFVLEQIGYDPRKPDLPKYKKIILRFLDSNPSYSREELLSAINLTEQQLKDMV